MPVSGRGGEVTAIWLHPVTSGGVAWNDLLPGDEARHDLDLNIAQRAFLRLRKPAHIVMGEADIVLQLLRQACSRGIDFGSGDDDIAAIAVELFGIGARCRLTALLDLVENALHGFGDVCDSAFGSLGRFLQICGRHGTLLETSRRRRAGMRRGFT
jgi:hypothetical protein